MGQSFELRDTEESRRAHAIINQLRSLLEPHLPIVVVTGKVCVCVCDAWDWLISYLGANIVVHPLWQSPLRRASTSWLVEDAVRGQQSYVDYLGALHVQIQSRMVY